MKWCDNEVSPGARGTRGTLGFQVVELGLGPQGRLFGEQEVQYIFTFSLAFVKLCVMENFKHIPR